jgi:hypothetical protein
MRQCTNSPRIGEYPQQTEDRLREGAAHCHNRPSDKARHVFAEQWMLELYARPQKYNASEPINLNRSSAEMVRCAVKATKKV